MDKVIPWGVFTDSGSRIASEVRALAANPPANPSKETLISQVHALEQDVQNTEFKLVFLYQHRESVLALIASLQRQIETLKD